MRIRHQIETPEFVQVTEEKTKRIRSNRWTPAIVMAAVVLVAARVGSKEITININTQPTEVDVRKG